MKFADIGKKISVHLGKKAVINIFLALHFSHELLTFDIPRQGDCLNY